MLWKIKQWTWAETNTAVPVGPLWLSGDSLVWRWTLPSTYINAAAGFIEILQRLKRGSVTQNPGVARLKEFSSSTKLVSTMWKPPVGKNKREEPSWTLQGGRAHHAATHSVNLAFSGRWITVALQEICKAGWAVSLSRQNRVPGTIHDKETPVLRGW